VATSDWALMLELLTARMPHWPAWLKSAPNAETDDPERA
jgi:hypothetical protein